LRDQWYTHSGRNVYWVNNSVSYGYQFDVEFDVTDGSLSLTPLWEILSGTTGKEFTQAVPFKVAGGVPPYFWKATGLPDGLTLSSSDDTASITGKPSTPGPADILPLYDFVRGIEGGIAYDVPELVSITVADSTGAHTTEIYPMTIGGFPKLQAMSPASRDGALAVLTKQAAVGLVIAVGCILGNHLKTGHALSLQNRPRELIQNKISYSSTAYILQMFG
jgi:hypothetical protein